MIYTIENDYLKVSVDTFGAQLQSILSKKTGVEYLWQGDPTYWKGRAYNLFPIIGRLVDDEYIYRDNTYSMKPHGMARYTELSLFAQSSDQLVFLFKDNDETRVQYPFAFEFYVYFTLKDNKLNVAYKVNNTDNKTIIFGLGGHPGINVPFAGGKFEDYYVEWNKATDVTHLTCAPSKLLSGEEVEFPLQDGKILPLTHDLFDDDAVILNNTSGKLAVKSKNSKAQVNFYYSDFKYLALWHASKTDAPFLCLEPWSAIPAIDGKKDLLATKKDMTHLEKGKSKTREFTFEFIE